MTGTQFKKDNLEKLSLIKSLQVAYLFNTELKDADNRENLGDSALKIEYGNYELPIRASDTIIY